MKGSSTLCPCCTISLNNSACLPRKLLSTLESITTGGFGWRMCQPLRRERAGSCRPLLQDETEMRTLWRSTSLEKEWIDLRSLPTYPRLTTSLYQSHHWTSSISHRRLKHTPESRAPCLLTRPLLPFFYSLRYQAQAVLGEATGSGCSCT